MSEARQGRIAPWAFAGVAAMMALLAVVWRYGEADGPARLLALKAVRVDLVGQMEVALGSAAEAEKSAVLAVTDQESQAFADRSRAATATVEQRRLELARLLETGGSGDERALLARFGEAFAALRAVDEEVLRLAVRNTNLKAHALAFGPAAAALADLDGALERLAARHAGAPQAAEVQRLADRARLGALRVQALLAPHIAEERDEEMTRLEATMAGHLAQARHALEALSGQVGAAEVAPAAAAFARYLELEGQVLALSRQNTNVRSLSLSLGRKRAALAACQDALGALQQAIQDEPIPGISTGRVHPTR